MAKNLDKRAEFSSVIIFRPALQRHAVMLALSATTLVMPSAFAQAVWMGANNSDWFDPGNWDAGAVPDASTDVLVDSGTVLVDQPGAAAAAVTLAGVGTLALTGTGSLAASGGVRVDGMLDISGAGTGVSITALTGAGVLNLGTQTLTITQGIDPMAGDSFSGMILGDGGLAVVDGLQRLENVDTGSTTVTVTGQGVSAYDDAVLDLYGASSAGTGIFSVSDAGFIGFHDASSAANAALAVGNGGMLGFTDTADAGSSHITIHSGGTLVFNLEAAADGATVVNTANGVVDISLTGRFTGSDEQIAIGSLSGAGDIYLGGGALSLGALNQNDMISGVVSDGMSANMQAYIGAPFTLSGGSLIKTGAGTLTLTGINTYTGDTTVAGGKLVVNGSIAGSALTTVAAGGTLGGSGTVGDTVIADDGSLAPGNSIGTLRVAGDLLLDDGAILAVELGARGAALGSGSSDLVAVTGLLTLDGTLNLTDAGGAGIGYYRIASYGRLDDRTLEIGTKPTSDTYALALDTPGYIDLLVVSPISDPGMADPKPEAGLGDDRLQHWQGGDGVWNAANKQWLNRSGEAAVAWAGHTAVFKNAGGVHGGKVDVGGTQSFEGLQFVDNGYGLSGPGMLQTVAGGSEIRVLADVTARIGTQIDGAGGISKTQGGTLMLSGDSSGFAGTTTVSAGMLEVNGQLGGNVAVDAGGILGGSGIIGSGPGSSVAIGTGATHAPSVSIGTQTINGDYSNHGRLRIEASPTAADQLIVNGHVDITGALLDLLLSPVTAAAWDIDTGPFILIANDGTDAVTGAFADVTQNLLFLDASIDYAGGTDANDVTLALTRNGVEFAVPALTPNQAATAEAIETLAHDSGVYRAIALASDIDLVRQSFDALSGELHASAKSALINDSRLVRDAMDERIRSALEGFGASVTPVLAYGPAGPELASASTGQLVAWGGALGAWGDFTSDGNAAGLDTSTGGLLAGADTLVGDWRLGLMAGYSRSGFDADDRQSSGSSDNYYLGLYGGTQWGNLGFRSGLAYTWHDMSTSRSVAVMGETLSGDYKAGTAQIFGELGYRIDTEIGAFEPFANLAHVGLSTDGFAERGGAAALSSNSQTTDTTFTTLGLRTETGFSLGEIRGKVRAMIGWLHAFGETIPRSTHAFAGSDVFTVAGVPIARDTALMEAGFDIDLTDTASFGVSYAGQIAGSVQDHGISVKLGVKF